MTVGSTKGAVRLAALTKPLKKVEVTIRARTRLLVEFMEVLVLEALMGYTSTKCALGSFVKRK